jgi:hypothetical protein
MSGMTEAAFAGGQHHRTLSGEVRPKRSKVWAHRMWNVGRVLMIAATVVLLYSYWVPWVVMSGIAFDGDQEIHYTLTLGPGDVDPLVGQPLWSSATMLLLVGCLLVCQRGFPAIAYVTALTFGELSALVDRMGPDMPTYVRADGNYIRLIPGSTPSYLDGDPTQWLVGYYLDVTSFCLLIVAALVSAISVIMPRDELRAAITRPRVRTRVSSVFTSRLLIVGILLWALGALVLSWRVGGCVQIPLVAQHCAPGGFGDMLQRGLSGDPALLNPRVGMYALPALLVYLALLALAGLLFRAPLRLLATWIGLWLAGSVGALAIAVRGLILTRPVVFGPGLFVALLGLLVAAGGLAWLLSHALDSRVEAPEQFALR